MSRAAAMPGVIATVVAECSSAQCIKGCGWFGLRIGIFAQVAHAAERGRVWFRRWQGAVSVVGCQCRCIEIVQFVH